MYRKLGRDSSARKALFRSMLTSFFQYERKTGLRKGDAAPLAIIELV